MSNTVFKEYFEVRDNEVDIQGIVSNVNYMIYLGHARHKYIQTLGIDFNDYAKRGHNFVVVECTQQFKKPLKPNDLFYVTCSLVQTDSPIRFSFEQEVRLKNSDELILKAHFITACINTQPRPGEKRFYIPDIIKNNFHQPT